MQSRRSRCRDIWYNYSHAPLFCLRLRDDACHTLRQGEHYGLFVACYGTTGVVRFLRMEMHDWMPGRVMLSSAYCCYDERAVKSSCENKFVEEQKP